MSVILMSLPLCQRNKLL